jgi:hypothetical protein
MADPTPTQVTQNLPAPYIEGTATALTTALNPLIGTPLNTASYAQQIAAQTPLQQQSYDLSSGLGNYQQYLNTAQQNLGPQAYQQYMSPYQQQVINSTLANYDIQAQQGALQNPANAIASGAFGGARQGVQQAQYQSQSDLNRAQLQASLLQSGFQNAQQQANQNFANYGTLASQNQSLLGNQITGLNTLGSQQQTQQQNILNAQAANAQTAAFAPYTQFGLIGQQVAQLMGGFPNQVQTYQATPTAPSTAQSLLGTGLGLGSLGKGLGLFG